MSPGLVLQDPPEFAWKLSIDEIYGLKQADGLSVVLALSDPSELQSTDTVSRGNCPQYGERSGHLRLSRLCWFVEYEICDIQKGVSLPATDSCVGRGTGCRARTGPIHGRRTRW